MPVSFRWILEGRLAGSGRPGLLASVDEDMEFLRGQGIGLVVTLTEQPLLPPAEEYGMRGLHFPIDDMGIPTPRASERVCREVVRSFQGGTPVVLHCKAGLGRTGTMLACCLVTLGSSAEEALAEVRRINRSFVQTPAQVAFIGNYARHLLAAQPGSEP